MIEISTATIEELEARKAAIAVELDAEDADLDALETEVRSINDELTQRKANAAKAAEIRAKIAEGSVGNIVENLHTTNNSEEKKMDKETRAKLFDALAEYIKGRATEEQRALLTVQASKGTVQISTIVDDFIWHDWDKSPILSRIRKVSVQGNYSVGYESSATGAVKHGEGEDAPEEEKLLLGYVTFISKYFKKWITVSDTVLAMRGEAFVRYLMDEFGHQLAIALENAVVEEITNSQLSAKVTNAIDNTAAMAGFAALSDEATNPVVIISKATYANIMNARATTGAKIEDPFSGMEVLFNRNVQGMLVGDLDGVMANFPEGEDFQFIVDDKSLAEKDMVKIVGKILGDVHLVRPNGFAVVTAA